LARQELVRSHLPLVRAIARRYAGRGEEFDDLVQAGSVGMVRASGRFDPSRGVTFATFVAPAVEGEIRRHLRERAPGVRIPREVQRLSTELRRCRSQLTASLGRSPDVRELAAALDADVAEVEQLIAADLARDPVALPAGDPATEPWDESESLADSEYRVLLAGGLRVLDERERRIVFLRFHADMTELQIARTVGISQAHVSRLLEGALAKLRTEFDAASAGAPEPADTTQSAVVSPEKAPVETKISPVGADERRQERRPAVRQRTPATAATPKPKEPSSYSGRFLVRMPSELHEQLVQAAEQRAMSLNRYVTDTLSSSVGMTSPDQEASTGSAAAPARRRAATLRMALATNLAIVVVAGVVAVVLLVLALQRGV
jgi:RNA polymerase sigma-B factor